MESKPRITVITASLMKDSLLDCIDSVLNQTIAVRHKVILDGVPASDRLVEKQGRHLSYTVLSENVGGGGYYGHRIYCAEGIMANTEYVAFLDEDCTVVPTWAERMLQNMAKSPIVTCRRNVIYNGNFLGVDNRESIGKNEFGYNLYDINTYMIKQSIVANIVPYLYGKWGADRDIANNFYGVIHHIKDPLVNYTVRDDRIEFYKEIV
jgi:GT2 family glycosyltransferase